jgi:galactokinase
MLKELTNILKHQSQLVAKMVELAKRQQQALVDFDVELLYDISKFQNDIAVSFKRVENKRLEILMDWFGISRNQAMKLRVSQLQNAFTDFDFSEMKDLRKSMSRMLLDLNNLNNTNRVLSNRAKHSVNEMMQTLTKKGDVQVCNVRV